MLWDLIGYLTQLWRKEDQFVLWEYIYELWTLQRKTPSFMSLIASMVFNDSFGVENYAYLSYE